MKIIIVNPFDGADKLTRVWANEEEKIDFRAEPLKAARCTLSFAATELHKYLERTIDAEIAFAGYYNGKDFAVYLHVAAMDSKADSFTLEPLSNGVRISGEGRTGALYGAYEFLRMQGWRWFAPGIEGEIAPAKAQNLKLPESGKTFRPSFSLGRGFIFECVSRESADLCLWMARNRMNVSGYRPSSGPLGEKLGMSPAIGGHIFEPILHQDRMLPSGKTIWEEHQEWYGLPADGNKNKDAAQRTQFCVSRNDLMEFLGKELLEYLNGKWKQADRVDVWGFDTWGATCHCPDCIKIGNSSDQTLYFVSRLRRSIDQARQNGSLDHDVKLVLCAYEGTATIAGPSKPVPRNLLDAGDYITFYPINRCYAHDFEDASCSWNSAYSASLKSWFAVKPALPVMIGEYYNVSKFEDLPMLFTARIAADLPAYHKIGGNGMTYMHLPFVNWAMRTQTQLLYAQLAWDVETDVPAFLEEYFRLWYGPYAEMMRQAYGLIEESWLYSSQWRIWSQKSILTQLFNWDGSDGRPPAGNDHLPPEKAVASGRNSIALMEKAMTIIRECAAAEKVRLAAVREEQVTSVVNPVLQREMEMRRSQYEKRLGEDRRLLLYGIDVMTAMTEITAYHNALNSGERDIAETAWQELEKIADKLDSYYIPISYEQPGAGVVSRDALTRSQLRDCLRRCRRWRKQTAL